MLSWFLLFNSETSTVLVQQKRDIDFSQCFIGVVACMRDGSMARNISKRFLAG